jgi:hypothetical protein
MKFVFSLQEVIDANLIPLIIDALETVWKHINSIQLLFYYLSRSIYIEIVYGCFLVDIFRQYTSFGPQ